VRGEPEGSLLLPGTFPVHDLPDLNVHLRGLPNRGYNTVAGLVLAELGRVPEKPGDRVEASGWEFEVVEVGRRAITSVRLRRAADARPRHEGSRR
jgi:putative hemolysin